MDNKTFWIIAGIAVVVLIALVIWQTDKISDIATAGSIKSAASSGSGMVGGC